MSSFFQTFTSWFPCILIISFCLVICKIYIFIIRCFVFHYRGFFAIYLLLWFLQKLTHQSFYLTVTRYLFSTKINIFQLSVQNYLFFLLVFFWGCFYQTFFKNLNTDFYLRWHISGYAVSRTCLTLHVSCFMHSSCMFCSGSRRVNDWSCIDVVLHGWICVFKTKTACWLYCYYWYCNNLAIIYCIFNHINTTLKFKAKQRK